MQIVLSKTDAIELLNHRKNEKDNRRILSKLNSIFDNTCELEGRGDANVRFILNIEDEKIAYYNLKLLLIERYNFRPTFDYDSILKLLYLAYRVNEPYTLLDISRVTGISPSMITYHRDKLKDLFKPKEYCKIQYYTNKGKISLQEYENIYIPFSELINKISAYPKDDYVLASIYIKNIDMNAVNSRTIYADYQIICYSPHFSFPKHEHDRLMSKGYEVYEDDIVVFINKKLNTYLVDTIRQIHWAMHNIEWVNHKCVYELTEKAKRDIELCILIEEASRVIKGSISFSQLNLDSYKDSVYAKATYYIESKYDEKVAEVLEQYLCYLLDNVKNYTYPDFLKVLSEVDLCKTNAEKINYIKSKF